MSEDEDGQGETERETPGRPERRLRLVKPDAAEPEPGDDPRQADDRPGEPPSSDDEGWPWHSGERGPFAGDTGPYPDPRTAFWLTVGGVFGTGVIGVFFFGLGLLPAIGIGHAIAVGALGSMAARRVPEPQTERMGLRSFDVRSLPMVLCLVPTVLVASELDNFAFDWSGGRPGVEQAAGGAPAVDQLSVFGVGQEVGLEVVGDEVGQISPKGNPSPEATGGAGQPSSDEAGESAGAEALDERVPAIDPTDPLTIAQAFVISAGIAPLVDEFFFRGVIQQSMVVRFGLIRGVAFVAMLYTLFHFPAFAEMPRLIIGLFCSFGMGMILGLVRAATGSILAPILLASLWSAVGIASMALQDRLPLPGMNVDGTHLPVMVAGFSFAIVAWAVSEVLAEAKRREKESTFT